MKLSSTRKYPKKIQYLIGIGLVFLVAGVCYVTKDLIGYRVVALILLMTVSFIAMFFEIRPVLISAVFSAIIWNFFFIPPLFTFHISHAEDVLMFLLYFVIALVNAVLTFKIREAESVARDKDEKENTIRLYNTLLNSLSHELRTPISTIIGAVDTLKENKIKLSQKNENDLLYEIDVASVRLNRQVENLLNMSRLESGMLKPKRDWCDVNELIFSVIQKLKSVDENKIAFSPNEQLPFFKLDEGLIEQVIHNLIHNGLQHTAANTVIKIDVSHDGSNCIIKIINMAEPFPENEIPKVFDKFYRVPNAKTGGSGLGLSIVKGFVEAHKGTVILENTHEGNATFTISIPSETTFLNNLKHE